MFKHRIPLFLHFGIIYKLQCGGYNATYYDKTKHNFKVKMCEDLVILAVARKRIKSDDDSAIQKHFVFWNHLLDFKDFSILTTNNSSSKFTLLGSLSINKDHPPLNNNKQSLHLEFSNY